MIRDDHMLLARMSPEYRVLPEAPTAPPAPVAALPPKTVPPSQQAARILDANPDIKPRTTATSQSTR